jgi:polyhydroxybutyrate depolymerase
MIRYAFALSSFTLLCSCAPAEPAQGRAPGRYVEKYDFMGKPREYVLIVPKSYDVKKASPVVVALHGLTSSMNAIETVMNLREKSEKEGFIALIPNGLPETFRGWNADFFKMAGDKNDVAFLEDVINRTEKEFNVDKRREFLFGHSNGAMMAYYVGAKLSNRLAAVAGIAGTIGIPNATSIPKPSTPISVLLIHGQKDKVVAYQKSDKAMLVPIGARDSAAWWAEQCECKGAPTDVKISELATQTTYERGKNGVVVSLISCLNGTHDVPGGNGETASGINAMDKIWEFFKANPKK